MYSWTKDNILEEISLQEKHVVVWFHDKLIFYVHNRQKKGWYYKDTPAKPYTKGEGALLMVADYVSANFGQLQSPDGAKNACQVMKPGKNQDGYLTSDDISQHNSECEGLYSGRYIQQSSILSLAITEHGTQPRL